MPAQCQGEKGRGSGEGTGNPTAKLSMDGHEGPGDLETLLCPHLAWAWATELHNPVWPPWLQVPGAGGKPGPAGASSSSNSPGVGLSRAKANRGGE